MSQQAKATRGPHPLLNNAESENQSVIHVAGSDAGCATVTGVDRILLVAVGTLPLTQALTLHLAFPLKIYEVAIILAIIVGLAKRQPLTHFKDDGVVRWAIALWLASFAGLAYSLTLQADRPKSSLTYRFSPGADGVLQLLYLLLAIVAYILMRDLATRHPKEFVSKWLFGAIASALYSCSLNLGSSLGVTLPTLPGTSSQVGYFNGHAILRAGTFLEGNFFGLFLVLSIGMAFHVERTLTAVVLSLALILTLSPLSLLGAAALWGVHIHKWLRTHPGRVVLFIAVLPALILLTAGPVFNYVGTLEQKLANGSSQSSIERHASATAAIRMFQDHPVSGVGIGQYNLWFPTFRPVELPASINYDRIRVIPNNIYAEIAAEQGILGLLLLGLLLVSLFVRALRTRSAVLVLTTVNMLLIFNAYSTYTLLFLWAFFGYLTATGRQASVLSRDREAADHL